MKKVRKKICLIDADSLLYESACIHENRIDFGNGNVVVDTDIDGAIHKLERDIQKIVTATGCTKYEMYITGPHNFRYEVLPTYKGNRKDIVRPILLDELREYILLNHPCKKTSKIEADDACTIKMSRYKGKYILAHIDKDLNQVEGTHYNWRDDLTYEVSEKEGISMFFTQVLKGDSTDGYTGCPNIGKEKVESIIDEYIGVEAYEYTLKRGKRAGEVEIRWKDVPMDDIWDVIVSQYLKAHFKNGTLTSHTDKEGAERLALQQARVARMLRHDEWVENEVILWNYTPLKIDLRRDS